MSVVNELIRSEQDGTLSFGNYLLDTKSKLSDFEHGGDMSLICSEFPWKRSPPCLRSWHSY